MQIKSIDHLVLTVADIEQTLAFYTGVLGFREETFGDNRKALCFGSQKINLHLKGHEIEPKAAHAVCGSADLCFIAATPVERVMQELQEKGIPIIAGIVDRTGALGKIRSVYLRDPDLNLIEISNYP